MHAAITVQERPSKRNGAYLPDRSISPIRISSEHRAPTAIPYMLFGSPELVGVPIAYERNSEIYGEGEAADYVYKVTSGAVRTYKVLNDGRRQINAFYLPGDCFGLELGDEHSWSAEAIVGSAVVMVKRTIVLNVSKRDNEVARQLWQMTADELYGARNHALLLIKTAQERVAAFLLEMSRRLANNDAVELPMGRQDIADHLGLTIETVSRTLAQLEITRAIELLTSRLIALRNRPALSRLNG
jgi:CRP/FNR family transcriptional regulator, nitrogen fixation regulation protein